MVVLADQSMQNFLSVGTPTWVEVDLRTKYQLESKQATAVASKAFGNTLADSIQSVSQT
jgi:hypothetical protein